MHPGHWLLIFPVTLTFQLNVKVTVIFIKMHFATILSKVQEILIKKSSYKNCNMTLLLYVTLPMFRSSNMKYTDQMEPYITLLKNLLIML